MLNICFSIEAMESLKQAVTAGYLIESETVCIPDDLSLGNISNLKNFETRKEILRKLHRDETYVETICRKCYRDYFSQLTMQDKILIWYANTPAEFCGLLYTLCLLKGKQVKIKAVRCSRTLKRGENQFVSYYSVSEVAPEEMIRFLPFEEHFTEEETTEFVTEWERLTEENGALRVYWNGCIQTADISYYDAVLMRYILQEPRPVSEIIRRFIAEERFGVSAVFILSRMNDLLQRGEICSDKAVVDLQSTIFLAAKTGKRKILSVVPKSEKKQIGG